MLTEQLTLSLNKLSSFFDIGKTMRIEKDNELNNYFRNFY